MKKEFLKNFADNIRRSNEGGFKSVKLNDLPFQVVQDFKQILGLNSIRGLDIPAGTKSTVINLFKDDKYLELGLEMFNGKDIEIYDFNVIPMSYNPSAFLQRGKPIVTPAMYDIEKIYSCKYFIIPLDMGNSEFSQKDIKECMIKVLEDMLDNPDKYAPESEYGLSIRFQYKDANELKYNHVDLQEDFFIPIKK